MVPRGIATSSGTRSTEGSANTAPVASTPNAMAPACTTRLYSVAPEPKIVAARVRAAASIRNQSPASAAPIATVRPRPVLAAGTIGPAPSETAADALTAARITAASVRRSRTR